MQLWAWLSVALATRTGRSALLSGANIDLSRSPVEKVTKLLRDMQTTLTEEAKEDAKLYKQLTCWCESGNTEKTAAVEQAEAEISRLESEIESRRAAAEQYVLDVKAGMEDQRKLKESLERADAQRQQAYDAYRKDLIQTRGDLELMKQAIYILREHQAVSFPQIKVGLLGMASSAGRGPADDLDKLSRWMDSHSFDQNPTKSSQVDTAVLQYEKKAGFTKPAVPGKYTESELALLARARKAVESFMQSHDTETSGTGHMGEILGILEQMKDDFTKHLEELDSTEKSQVEEYNGMVDGLKKALDESEKITMAKEMKAAENKKAKADAAELLEATKTGLDADTAFLVNMRATCAAQDKEWAERTEMRQTELKAVGEALRILDSDDNKDLATKTLGDKAVGFLQLGMDSRAERAASVLTRAGKGLLAALARQGKFPKVIKAIDEMVVALKQQQKEEVEHKDFCSKKFHEIEITTMKKTNTQSGLQAKLDATANELETIAEEKTQITTEITDTTVALQSANADRVSESQEFQTVVSDQRAVKAVLLEVLDKLEKVYGKSFLQEEKPGSKDQMVKFWGKSWGKGHAAAQSAAAGSVTATVVRAVEITRPATSTLCRLGPLHLQARRIRTSKRWSPRSKRLSKHERRSIWISFTRPPPPRRQIAPSLP
jgi:hypothetical protein